jgi:hypothetical protein
MNPLVSIIVPCYKQAHFLKESLQSVLDQSYEHWECIVVNDGSPDHTEAVVEKWMEKDKRFTYIYQDNKGLSSARNKGIKNSQGEYILPLDADDILDPYYLKKLVPVLQNDIDLGIVSCYSNFFYQKKENVIFQLKTSGNSSLYLLYVNQLIATSLFRKECWLQTGGYDETMKKGFEDWDFWLSITKLGWKYTIIPEFLFNYRKSHNSMLTITIQHHAEEVKQYIFTKHKDLYINDFDNCMEVLFHELRVQRLGHHKYKTGLEYKIGKVILKPFSLLLKALK